jgi:glycosyltransferase involved in cell wall biosynthesis
MKVEQLGLGSKITFLGGTENKKALDFISQSTMFVLPSVIAPNGDRDGIPTALIESMYLKIPVIGSRISGIPELIDDGINGFLAEPGDVNQIAEKMNKLISDKLLRDRMGKEAREKIKKEFNIENSTNKLIDAWYEMLQI